MSKAKQRNIPKRDAIDAWEDIVARANHIFAYYFYRNWVFLSPIDKKGPAFIVLQNAALECSLMSIRGIDEFLASNPKKNDAVATDYGFPPGKGFLSLEERNRISQHLAHLTYRALHEQRQSPFTNPRTWEYAALAKKAINCFTTFLDHLAYNFFADDPVRQLHVWSARNVMLITLENVKALAEEELTAKS